jgi:mannose-1-phosphate guanylyltransferase
MSSTDAVILVGGMGTRLRPLTLSAPKPMLPTAGVPFLTHLIARIRDAGISHVVLGTSYRAEVFESYFSDGSAFGVELEYVVETEPLGTGGGIRNVAPRLHGDDVMIFNGDVLSGVDLRALLATHAEARADVTLYLTKVEDPRAFGCVPTDADGRVTAFLEKDPNPVTDQINAGTYVFTRSMLESIPAGRPVSVERETFPGLLASGAGLVGHVDSTYWRDLGRPADFVAGSADLVLGLAPSPALPGPTGAALVLPGATVAADAVLSGGTTVGAGC